MNGNALIRGLASGAAIALTALAIPAVAGAADYCVGQGLGCDGPHTVQYLDQALDKADDAADADRILLSAGVHMPSNAFGFEYTRADAPIEIVGQGAGTTIITRPNGVLGAVLALEGGSGSFIHDLTVRVPENATGTPRALDLTGLARDIVVDEHPNQVNQRFGVEIGSGGRLENSTVTLDSTDDTIAVRTNAGGGIVRDSILSAGVGLYSNWGATVERSRVIAGYDGIAAYHGTTTVSSSLIAFGSAGDGDGIVATTQPGADTTVNADGVTIVGSGLPYTFGAWAANHSGPAQNARVNLTNSIIRGASNAFYAGTPDGATGHASVSATYSDYSPTGREIKGANASISESNVTNVGAAGFVNAAGGDYHLVAGSPLIDAGDPATAQGLDFDGNPLVVDGNLDGTARRDLGAFELARPLTSSTPSGGQPVSDVTAPAVSDVTAPVISGFRVTRTKRGTRIRFALTESAKVTLKIQRAAHASRTSYRTIGRVTRTGASGANTVKLGRRLATRLRVPGRYRVRITATDAAGNRSAAKTTRFRVGQRR
jgi:hypothetical protein